MAKGKKAFEQKSYQTAILYFKNAMQRRPRDAEPYYQLGLAYRASGDMGAAASYFRRAAELNPKHTGAQLRLAELMLASRRKDMLEDAQRRTLDILNQLPDDADALNVLALTELQLGQPENAEAHLEQALRRSPGHLRSSLALARSRLGRRDVVGAERALKEAVAQAPESIEPIVHLGIFYLALGRTEEAEQQLDRALRMNSNYGPALLALGGMQVRAGKLDQAEITYRRLSSLPEKQYHPIHALFLLRSGRLEQAIAELERLTKEVPSDRKVRTSLVQGYLAMKRDADAERLLTAALKTNAADTDASLQRGRIYLARGKYSHAEADLERVLRFHSDSAEAHYLLSKVRQGRGEIVGRKRELGDALRLDPKFLPARLELAQILTADHGAQSAVQLLDEAPGKQEQMAVVLVEKNWALLKLGQLAEARKGIDRLLARSRPADAVLQDAVLKLKQKDHSGAQAAAEEVLRQRPEEMRALNVLFQSYAGMKQTAGVERIREYASRRPGSATIQEFLGLVLMYSGDRGGARVAFEAARTASPGRLATELALAGLDAAEGGRDKARTRLAAVVSAHPANIAGRLLWADLELADGRLAAAIDQYRRVLELDPKNVAALNNLSYLLADGNQPDEALKYAQEAKDLAPEDAAIDDTLGWAYFRKGLYIPAVRYLESAVARDGTARRRYHLAMAYAKAGDLKRGREALALAMKMDPTLPESLAAKELIRKPRL